MSGERQQVFNWEFGDVQTISLKEFENKLRAVKGAKTVSVVTVTVPSNLNKNHEKKPNPYYGRTQKRAYNSVMINFRYENSVNRQREREDEEPDFVSQPRTWGDHVKGGRVENVSAVFDLSSRIEHEGKSYVKCKVDKMPYMFDKDSRIEHDGKFYFECDASGLPVVFHWTPLIEYKGKLYLECKLERNIATQYIVDGEVVEEGTVEPYLAVRKESSRQGVKKTVKPFDPMLTNIETIVMGGETYTIAKEEGVAEEVAPEEVPV